MKAFLIRSALLIAIMYALLLVANEALSLRARTTIFVSLFASLYLLARYTYVFDTRFKRSSIRDWAGTALFLSLMLFAFFAAIGNVAGWVISLAVFFLMQWLFYDHALPVLRDKPRSIWAGLKEVDHDAGHRIRLWRRYPLLRAGLRCLVLMLPFLVMMAYLQIGLFELLLVGLLACLFVLDVALRHTDLFGPRIKNMWMNCVLAPPLLLSGFAMVFAFHSEKPWYLLLPLALFVLLQWILFSDPRDTEDA